MSNELRTTPLPWYRTGPGLVLIGLAAAGGLYGLSEHWAHALPYLPWLLLLACPLMHLFMHRGHGSHGSHGGAGASEPGEDQAHSEAER